MFVNTLAKKPKTASGIYGNPHINLCNRKESVLCIEVTKKGKKLLVLLNLQGQQASVWVFILVHCMVNFFTKTLAKFEFPARRSNKTCLKAFRKCSNSGGIVPNKDKVHLYTKF